MLINSLPDRDGSRCTLTYDEHGPWLRAIWRGFVDQAEAIRGAENYLNHAGDFRCAALLNDNLALHGPWFSSLEWLEWAWWPRAQHLGLRYVAHVVQADTHEDLLTLHFPHALELQFFHQVCEAEDWLRSCPL